MRKKRNTSVPGIWVSQNYLTNGKTIKKVLQITTITKHDRVIEIGPGKGHITGQLLKKCRQLTAVEIDDKLFNMLRVKFDGVDNLKLFHGDFLAWTLPASGDYKVVANTPFCFTTDILRKLTECGNPPVEAWLTMEKGAAKRFMGKPRESLRSLMIKPLFELDIVFYFNSEEFHPRPCVDAVLLHLKRKKHSDIPSGQLQTYERFIRACLGRPSNFKNVFTARQLPRALREAGVRPGASEEMLYVQWLCLFRTYCKLTVKKR